LFKWSRRSPRTQPRGFTFLETLVLIGILLVLLSIFIPYLLSIRESNRRLECADHLKQILRALQSYSHDNNGVYPKGVYDRELRPDGYTAFTGADDPDPFIDPGGPGSVRRSDVSASLWLLVRGKYVKDPAVFVCPSSDDDADSITDESAQPVDPTQRGNFRWSNNLSYSYADPFSSAPGYRLNDTKPADFVLMADKNPGEPAAQYEYNAPSLDLAKANSHNHGGAGQNVLFAYGEVRFIKTPYCGIGQDNIYTARAASVQLTTQPTTLPNNVRGVVGTGYGPVGNDDTYLVPTATDDFETAPATRPTSHPATTMAAAPATTALAPSTIPSTAPATTTTSSPTTTTQP
jgi:type II secretory pathway pseudopilin PulG